MAAAGAVDGGAVTRRSGLGRGLDALLPDDTPRLEESGYRGHVAIEAISPSPRQPRRDFDEESLEELAASIRHLGVLQPLLVRSLGDGTYQLIAGERRLRAARLAGRADVPVLILETDDEGALERALVENVHRADLNPIEEAAAYRQLMQDGRLTQQELAERVGRNRVTITNSLRLLELPPDVQRLMIDRRLTAAHGKALLGLERSPFLPRLARRVVEEDLSVRESEEMVRRYQEMSGSIVGSRRSGAGEPSPRVAEARRVLADVLQTRVRIDIGKRKGKIVLDFVSLDELDRITSLIAGSRPEAGS